MIGMFLGGAGLADTMLYCRDKIYPLGLPNSFATCITAIALYRAAVPASRRASCRRDAEPLDVSMQRKRQLITGRFSLLAVTTLEKLLLSTTSAAAAGAAQVARGRGAADRRCCAPCRRAGRQARPARCARRPFRGSGRDHHRGRQLATSSSTARPSAPSRAADQFAARAAAVLRQARRLSARRCPSCASSSPRS